MNRSRPSSCQLPELLVVLPLSVLGAMSSLLALAAADEQQPWPITLHPNCTDKCGNISIPYPFGVEPGCFLEGFHVTCNYSFHPPRLFLEFNSSDPGSYHQLDTARYEVPSGTLGDSGPLEIMPVELMEISLDPAEVRAYGLVRSSCLITTNISSMYQIRRLQATTLMGPFVLAPMRNVLIGVDSDKRDMFGAGMLPIARDTGHGDPFTYFGVNFRLIEANLLNYPCSYGMLVESSWYNFSTEDMVGYDVLTNKHPRGVPFVIDFAIRNGSCPVAGGPPPPADYACLSGNSSCANATNGQGYVCKCLEHYDGNPYIPNGCQDIDECALPDQYPCSSGGICSNRLGGYDCPCKFGMRGDGKAGTCTDQFPLPAKIVVGVVGALLATSICVFLILLRREKRRMKEYFDKNGGPILKEVSNIKIFKKEQLKPILKSYNIVGKGAFGEVYKGLVDDKQVAVKKPAVNVDAAQKGQFANEVIIQSRIIHKNIVRLIGCCLEVDVPILVYEFIAKGSLDDILHGHKKEALNLDQRLCIAAESAEGLAYMHSKTTNTILHGDVKPANILLNDEFVPKISDFGISRLIAIDKAQHTNYVIGDMSYMDPVYQQTGLLTKKSDVYSFGVVLLELISRKKATYADHNSLVMSFLDAHKTQSRTTELFDKDIIRTARDIELLECLAGIAVECLQYDVDQRPEMTDVAERLLMLRRSHGK
ncbi:hypothetical protein BS78_05G024300 [Paspalum vaginatum]|nr:hypothetical protein BS78_05G024300 [Paspalum vaginatum]